jgi:dimeric dUTPase (all-alpha-NTP-PPase superfamily)
MNLEKLFQTQKVLRDRIGYNEPDRFNKLILALLVELGECANEWRGFKFWSVNQIPHTSAVRVPTMMEEDKEYYNPLLEEYVDCLHFILELGLELHAVEPWNPQYEEDITEQFRTLFYHVSMINTYNGHDAYEYTVSYFLGLGEMLGFTGEEIEQAYFAKNKINHVRQETGY